MKSPERERLRSQHKGQKANQERRTRTYFLAEKQLSTLNFQGAELEFRYQDSPSLAKFLGRIETLKQTKIEQLNFRRFMIKEYHGAYYTERTLIKLKPDWTVECNDPECMPTAEEQKELHEEFEIRKKGDTDLKPWPTPTNATHAQFGMLKIKIGAHDKDLFPLFSRNPKDRESPIRMVQQRCSFDDGTKAYLPWTFFSDGEWRRMEPDSDLPFWKPEKKQKNKIMVHEGAKAARHIDWMINSDDLEAQELRSTHPWAEELSHYEHWGLIGGALAPHRADYAEIRREGPTDLVYVCDNDRPGVKVMSIFSRLYGGKMKAIRFDARWPPSFDLADPMPKYREATNDNSRREHDLVAPNGRWIGPSLWAMTSGATFATARVPDPENPKKEIIVLRDVFAEEWLHSLEPEFFVHPDWPDRLLNEAAFNSKNRPFSHTKNLADLLKMNNDSKADFIDYDPAKAPGVYSSNNGGRYINTHIPSPIKPEKGDVSLFLNYINHLVPIEEDRRELLRWCATLVNHPANKMMYGVLLISETQGVGKSTLGEKILLPLVGENNVTIPSETEIVDSSFNDWLAQKRLAIVHEIYAGNSSKAYNKLKSVVTEKKLRVNRKFVTPYDITNWMHLFCSSNSVRALKLDLEDRRWFVPRLSEEKRPAEFWTELNRWLTEDGGLGKIKHWMQDWLKKNGGPVLPGQEAPGSTLKKVLAADALSDGQKLVHNLLNRIKEEAPDADLVLLDTDLVQFIKDQLWDGRASDRLEKPSTVRRAARLAGWFTGEKQISLKAWDIRLAGPKIIASKKELALCTAAELHEKGLKPLNPKDFLSI